MISLQIEVKAKAYSKPLLAVIIPQRSFFLKRLRYLALLNY